MSHRHLPSRLRTRPLLLAVALANGFAALPAGAQPTGAQAIHGTATLSRQGANLFIATQNGAGTRHSAINWQSFSIPGGSTTYFAQPDAASTSINRVLGGNPSAIFGTLASNGRLVLVNPAGITVGAGAVVDTAGFTASTLRMTDADAIAGRLRFGDGSAAGPLRVDGRILASSGDVVLIGTDVQAGAQAVIQSPQGATVLAAGQKVELTGRGLEGIHLEVQAPSDQAVNLGTLQGDAVGIFAGTLRHSGLIQASAASVQGGRVVLKATDHAETSGTVIAQGAAGAGGQVDVLGRTVGVMAGAVIDTSGTNGGGRIRVGGDYLGGNPDVPNAQVTYVAADAQLRANATDLGDGGRVIVWADDTTRVHGSIQARGGAHGGDGGFVETSGKRYLDANGARVDASASAGQGGRWLLDPSDLTIKAAGVDTTVSLLSPFLPGLVNSLLTLTTLQNALSSGTSVILRTDGSGSGGSGNVVFDASGGPLDIVHGGTGTSTLTVDAYNDIVFSGGATSFRTQGGSGQNLQVNLQAGNAVRTSAGATVALSTDNAGSTVTASVLNGKTWTNNGTLTLNQNGKLDLGSAGTFINNGLLNGAAGSLGGVAGGTFRNVGTTSLTQGDFNVGAFSGGGSVFYQGNSFSTGTLDFDGSQLKLLAAGNVTLSGASSVRATGDVELGFNLSASAIDLEAGGSLTTQALTTQGSDGSAGSGQVKLKAGGNVVFTDITTSGTSSMPNGGKVQIDAGNKVIGGNITTGGASFTSNSRGGAVQANAGSGGIFLSGSVRTHDISGYGAHGGAIGLTAKGGQIEVMGNLSAFGNEHTSGVGGAGGGITVSNTGGGITIHGDVDTSGGSGSLGAAGGGMVQLSASGAVNVYGSISSYGGSPWWGSGDLTGAAAGNIDVSAGGDIEIGNIYAWGGSANGNAQGGAGGKIALSTPGNITVWGDIDANGGGSSDGSGGHGQSVTLAAGKNLQVDTLYAYGGYSGNGGQGGDAASINLSYGGQLQLGWVDGSGGDGGYNSEGVGGAGGRGATLTITKENGDLELADLYLNLDGGWGGDGRIGGQGGLGGTINLIARNGGVKVTGAELSVRGGTGGYSYGGPTDTGGTGGQGGAIRISATGASQIMAWLDASGGTGGDADYYAQSRGGNGGNGGSIDIQVGGPLTLGGGLWAGGGDGGQASAYAAAALVPTSFSTDPARAGGEGGLGSVYLAAAGGITVPTATAMPLPTPTPTIGLQAALEIPPITGGTDLLASLQVDGALTNASSMRLESGATMLVGGPVTNNGAIDLGTNATMAVGYTYDPAADSYTFGSGTLTNAAGALLTGSGTVQGSVVNAGTVAPGEGGVGRIGQLSITGNYQQTATGRLDMDVAANSPFVPGVTYDQLNVGGSMTMGGRLVVNAVPALAATSATQLAPGTTSGSAAPAPTQFYELLKASAAGGSFDRVDGPIDLRTNIRMNINGAILDIPGNVLAGPADGLLAAISAMLPGVPLSELQGMLIQSLNGAFRDKDKDDKASGESDIVVTDASCKPAS